MSKSSGLIEASYGTSSSGVSCLLTRHILSVTNRGTIGAFLDGATETTAVFFKSLILMLVSSPEAQSKAHKSLIRWLDRSAFPFWPILRSCLMFRPLSKRSAYRIHSRQRNPKVNPVLPGFALPTGVAHRCPVLYYEGRNRRCFLG
jgi:hypothetical protein